VLKGKTVAIQGCGHVGYYWPIFYIRKGAAGRDRYRRRQDEGGGGRLPGDAVGADEIYGIDANIFAPCALGGIINDQTIPQLKVDIVAGGANNQLAEERHGDMLEARGITYAPDYVINAAGW